MDTIRVLIVDDHQLVRQGVRAFLETQPDLEVLGEADNGAEAVKLAAQVVPVEVYLDEALKLANEIAARPPIAVRFAKEAINKAFESSLSEGLEFERRLFYFTFATDDQKEGMRAFVEKRKAEWTGR